MWPRAHQGEDLLAKLESQIGGVLPRCVLKVLGIEMLIFRKSVFATRKKNFPAEALCETGSQNRPLHEHR